MKTLFIAMLVLGLTSVTYAQDENIVEIMDELRADWDTKVQFLKSYDDLANLCRNRDFRRDLIALLDNIHHYDTTLYNIVRVKYWENNDTEAKATLDDITKLEREFTTANFRNFVHEECGEYNMVENSFGHEGEQYENEKKRVQAALNRYVAAITRQIDTIDDHAHHLDLN